MTEREAAILDRADAGIPAAEIAAQLDLTASYVRQLVALYRISDHEHGEWRRAAKRSNSAFLAAIAATGRTFS